MAGLGESTVVPAHGRCRVAHPHDGPPHYGALRPFLVPLRAWREHLDEFCAHVGSDYTTYQGAFSTARFTPPLPQ